ncbi:MAG: MFS transporter, partial [Actinocrinis sp.]
MSSSTTAEVKDPGAAASSRTVPGAREAGSAGTGAAATGPLLWTVLIAMFMAVLDVAVVNVALPTIRTELHASGAGLQLAVSGYTISYAVLIVTGARLGDLLGHGRMFRAGLALFTLSSLACGLAPTSGTLIAFRALQGVGAAAMVPQVLSIIQRNFDGPGRLRATSLYTAVIAGGAAVGQVVGGLLVSANLFGSTWRPVFLINVPVGVAALVISRKVLPKDRGEPGRGLDPAGVAVLTPTVLAIVLPLVLGHDENWPLWGWILLAAGAVGVGLFIAVEARVGRRGGTPIIPARTLKLPGFSLSVSLMFLVMAVLTGAFFAMTLHLQSALGFSALDAGLAGAPAAAAIFLVAMRWRKLPPRTYPWLIV